MAGNDRKEASVHSKEFAKGAFWSLAGQIGIKLVGFFYLVIIARMASQNDVGTFYLALSIFGVLSVFSDAGFASAFQRYVPYFIGTGEIGKLRALLKVCYAVITVLCVILGIAIFLTADIVAGYFHNPELAVALRLLSPYLLVNTLFSLDTGFINGRKMMKEYSVLINAQTVAKFVLTVLLFFVLGATLLSIAAGFVLSFLFVLLLSFLYMRKPLAELGEAGAGVDMVELMREVVPFGLTMSLINSLWIVINYTDRILIGYMMNPSVASQMVAVYSMATGLSMLVMIFPAAIGAIFFPMISELVGRGKKEDIIELCETSMRWIIFTTFPITLVMLAFPDSLLRMFYGDAYAVGGVTMAIFTLGLFIRSLSTVESLVLGGMRLIGLELRLVIISAIANIFLNWMLIPYFGINGASAASAVAFLIATIMFIYYARKYAGFRFPPEAVKALVAGIIALGLILLIKPFLTGEMSVLPVFGSGDIAAMIAKVLRLAVFGVLFAISAGLYVALLFALKSFSHEDVNVLHAMLKRVRVPADWSEKFIAIVRQGVHSDGVTKKES
jgi:stage V sporulation protein B